MYPKLLYFTTFSISNTFDMKWEREINDNMFKTVMYIIIYIKQLHKHAENIVHVLYEKQQYTRKKIISQYFYLPIIPQLRAFVPSTQSAQLTLLLELMEVEMREASLAMSLLSDTDLKQFSRSYSEGLPSSSSLFTLSSVSGTSWASFSCVWVSAPPWGGKKSSSVGRKKQQLLGAGLYVCVCGGGWVGGWVGWMCVLGGGYVCEGVEVLCVCVGGGGGAVCRGWESVLCVCGVWGVRGGCGGAVCVTAHVRVCVWGGSRECGGGGGGGVSKQCMFTSTVELLMKNLPKGRPPHILRILFSKSSPFISMKWTPNQEPPLPPPSLPLLLHNKVVLILGSTGLLTQKSDHN